jgi:hypothetical protein
MKCLIFLSLTVAANAADLRPALLLHASFDGKLDADFAAGDATLYTSASGSRTDAKPGLPDADV